MTTDDSLRRVSEVLLREASEVEPYDLAARTKWLQRETDSLTSDNPLLPAYGQAIQDLRNGLPRTSKRMRLVQAVGIPLAVAFVLVGMAWAVGMVWAAWYLLSRLGEVEAWAVPVLLILGVVSLAIGGGLLVALGRLTLEAFGDLLSRIRLRRKLGH